MKKQKCIVELGKTDLFGQIKTHDQVNGYFYGVFQFAKPFTALLRGEQSGQISYPVAVVEAKGKLRQIDLNRVSFVEEKEIHDETRD
ncbi:MAG: hypothetical protein ABF912_13150 [Lacticaseibacillus paracasei]